MLLTQHLLKGQAKRLPLGSKGSELLTGLCKIIHLSINNKFMISDKIPFHTNSNEHKVTSYLITRLR